MANYSNQDFSSSFFKNKHFKKFLLATLTLDILIFIIAIIIHGKSISSIILSNYFFTVGIILLILGTFSRGIAWGVHKKSVLKPHQDNENDLLIAKDKLKLLAKILGFMGLISMLISLIFAINYY